MYFIGIDPGTKGAIAALNEQGGIIDLRPFEGDAAVIANLVLTRFHTAPTKVVIERVSSSPQMGVASSFTFGRAFGEVLGVLVAHGAPWALVESKQWQRAMGVVYPKGEKRDKNITKVRAQKFFPGMTVTHATADALLIAAYCRRCHVG